MSWNMGHEPTLEIKSLQPAATASSNSCGPAFADTMITGSARVRSSSLSC